MIDDDEDDEQTDIQSHLVRLEANPTLTELGKGKTDDHHHLQKQGPQRKLQQ